MIRRNLKMQFIAAAASLALLLPLSSGTVLAAPAASSATTWTQSLWEGTSGPAVSRLQEQLKTLGYYSYPRVDGRFGPFTLSGVHQFQAAYGLPVKNVADGATQTALTRAVTMRSLATDTTNYTGIPYRWGGSSPAAGFDCSGFVWFMYHNYGLPLARVTSERYFAMGFSVDRSHLQPGDLVFFNTGGGTASHMGIYIGGGKWVSATSSKGIWTNSLDNSYWGPRYNGARRV